MLVSNITWVAVVTLALAAAPACKKQEAPPPAATPDQGANMDTSAAKPTPAPAAPTAGAPALPEPIAKFKAALDRVLAKPDGVERARAACAANMFEVSEPLVDLPAPARVDAGTWSKTTNALAVTAGAIDNVCTSDGGGPEQATDVVLTEVTAASQELQALIALLPK